MRFRYLVLISLGILLQLGFPACENENFDSHEPTTWVVLLDMSGVREDPDMRRSYADNFNRIVKHVKGGDMLAVAFITEASANELSLLTEYRFPRFEPTTTNRERMKSQRKKYDKLISQTRDSLSKHVTDVIHNSDRIAPMTEIISAVHVGATLLHKGKTSLNNLVLFSDMEEYSNDYKFTAENLDSLRINHIIDKERSKQRGLPDLNGAKVIVAGANSNNANRFYAIRSFWMNYFKACGAQLHEDDYGAALSGF